jgi:Zn-dependent protease
MLLGVPGDQLGAAIIAYCIIILLCFPLHEFGHAWVATRLGDHLAESEGRVTLNPAAHIDPIGALILLVAPFGWAKPVPFNPGNLRKAPSISVGIILVSIAGVTMNLLLAALAALPFRLHLVSIFDLASNQPIAEILWWIVYINLVLLVFNLIPIPPLDGSKILEELLPPQFHNIIDFINQYGLFLLILFILPIFNGNSLAGILVTPLVSDLSRLLMGF